MGELTCIHFAHEDTSLVKIKATGELKLNDSPVCGEGYFASLEPQKIPAKKSKNGHNDQIWHLLHAGYFIYAKTRGTCYQTVPTKGTLTILIPFPNPLHKRSRAVNRFAKNGKANFGSSIKGNPKYSGQKKPK